MNKIRVGLIVIILFILTNILTNCNVRGCKDIIACGDATNGDFNLLLKVRDPSREGLQVITIVPKNYKYTYRYPWTGKPFDFTVTQKFIGIATKGDVIPNIVKAGMGLSEAGVAYGDADTDSNWINPTKYAWDDFDWIRYASQKANDEEDAVKLLTNDAVKKLHAAGVSENLFVVGPNKGYVIEADAFHYNIKEFDNGITVMSNYPKELWKTQIKNTLPISRSFDIVIEKYVKNKAVIRLRSLYGIKIVEIGEDFISVTPMSFIHALKTQNLNVITKIDLGKRGTVGYFSVELKDINGNQAKIRVCNIFKAWGEEMLGYIQPKYGDITLKDMFNWSRLHSEELDGLRPMCQDSYKYEAVAVYKIPKKNYDIMSCGWFSPNHACSSIYVPFHICNTDIYDSYKTGEAAELSLNLLKKYGHGYLNKSFSKTEEVFLNEQDSAEKISIEFMEKGVDISDFLTDIDMGMQRQAMLTEQIWMGVINTTDNDKIINILNYIWMENYSSSINNMKNSISELKKLSDTQLLINNICKIALDICKSRIDAAKSLGKQTSQIEEEYTKGTKLIEKGQYESGFDTIQKTYTECDMLIRGQTPQISKNIESEKNKEKSFWFLISIVLLLIGSVIVIIGVIPVFKKINK